MNTRRVNFITLTSLIFKKTKYESTSVNYKRIGANEGKGNSASQEEIQTFIEGQKCENTTRKTVSDMKTFQ